MGLFETGCPKISLLCQGSIMINYTLTVSFWVFLLKIEQIVACYYIIKW